MKAILEFNLEEEREEYETMMKARDYYSALLDISNLVKTFEDKFSCLSGSSAVELFDEFKTAVFEAVTERNIEL